jgi:hypothetical protein
MNTNASSDNLPTNINKTQGNYAFIDSQNLNLGLKNIVKNKLGKVLHSGWDLDFARFRIFLKDKYKVKKAFLFIGFMPGNEKLYQYLQEAGYICIFKPTLAIKSDGKNKIKGNCDAELVLHSMIEIDNYNKAIIVSGDGDFYFPAKTLGHRHPKRGCPDRDHRHLRRHEARRLQPGQPLTDGAHDLHRLCGG